MFGIVCPVVIVATDIFDALDSCMDIGLGKLSMGGGSTERKGNRRGRDRKMKEVEGRFISELFESHLRAFPLIFYITIRSVSDLHQP
jgi:hypothetical protein